jgi:hypothetical protein
MQNFIAFILSLNNYIYLIGSIIFSFLFTTLVLDGFKLSEYKIIKWLQLILLPCFGLIFLIVLKEIIFPTIIEFASEGPNEIFNSDLLKDTNVKVSGNVSGSVILTPESAKEISKGISSAASNIGLGAAIGATASAMATCVKSLPIPPVQKVGAVVLGAAVGGSIHVGVTAANRALAEGTNLNSSNPPSPTETTSASSEYIVHSPYETAFTDSINSNPVDTLLSSIITLNICNLILIWFLIVSLLSKIALNSNLELKWLDKLLPQPYSNKLKPFINKLLKLFGKSSSINIIIIIILLIISNIGSTYLLTELSNNFETFCKVYLNHINK